MKRNITKIKITGYPERYFSHMLPLTSEESREINLAKELERLACLRTARKIGDTESINNTQLGKLQDTQIPFEIIS